MTVRASTSHLSFAQFVAGEKSNQTAAIPKPLPGFQSSLVTVDALGCQVENARRIVSQKADDVLSVKGNQPMLFSGLVDHSPGLKGPLSRSRAAVSTGPANRLTGAKPTARISSVLAPTTCRMCRGGRI